MNQCVCVDCGHEQTAMLPCGRCDSYRVVLIEVLKEHFGEKWRDLIAEKLARKQEPHGAS